MDTLDILVHMRDAKDDSLAARAAVAISQRTFESFCTACTWRRWAPSPSAHQKPSCFKFTRPTICIAKSLARKGWWEKLLADNSAQRRMARQHKANRSRRCVTRRAGAI